VFTEEKKNRGSHWAKRCQHQGKDVGGQRTKALVVGMRRKKHGRRGKPFYYLEKKNKKKKQTPKRQRAKDDHGGQKTLKMGFFLLLGRVMEGNSKKQKSTEGEQYNRQKTVCNATCRVKTRGRDPRLERTKSARCCLSRSKEGGGSHLQKEQQVHRQKKRKVRQKVGGVGRSQNVGNGARTYWTWGRPGRTGKNIKTKPDKKKVSSGKPDRGFEKG